MTDWKEYSIYINEDAENSVSEILIKLGAIGVSIKNSEDFERLPATNPNVLWGLNKNNFPDQGVVISAYFTLDSITNDFHKKLYQKLEFLKKLELNVKDYTVETKIIKDENWENNWKEYYHSVSITRYLTIVPKWEDYQLTRKNEQLIILDPGLAFGTGTHPTTQLSIQSLETIMRGGEQVIDVGTGSGVLTIASGLLGASEIYAYDLDKTAINSARSNIKLNNLPINISVEQNNLLKGINLKVDIVVANMLSHLLLELIEDAIRVLKKEGFLISSGIIIDKKEQMLDALRKEGFNIIQVNQIKDWLVIIAQKPF